MRWRRQPSLNLPVAIAGAARAHALDTTMSFASLAFKGECFSTETVGEFCRGSPTVKTTFEGYAELGYRAYSRF